MSAVFSGIQGIRFKKRDIENSLLFHYINVRNKVYQDNDGEIIFKLKDKFITEDVPKD